MEIMAFPCCRSPSASASFACHLTLPVLLSWWLPLVQVSIAVDSVSCCDPELSCLLLLSLLVGALYLLFFLLISQLIRPGTVAKVIAYAVSRYHTLSAHPGLTKIVRSFLWDQVSSPSLEPGYLASNSDSIFNNVYEQVTFLSGPQFLLCKMG